MHTQFDLHNGIIAEYYNSYNFLKHLGNLKKIINKSIVNSQQYQLK